MSLHSCSISIPGGTQGLRDTTQICCSVFLSNHTQSLFEAGHRDTGTQLESAVLSVSSFILHLYGGGTQGHKSNPLYCMSLHSYYISIWGGTQGHRDTTRILCSVCLSMHTQSLFEVGHRDTGTQLKSLILYVSLFILHLYSRWDTGTQGHNSNQLFCLSLHSYSISIRGGTQGNRGTTRITYTVRLSVHTPSLFEVGHRDTGTQLQSAVLSGSLFILIEMKW
jgi:hypothetical protein